MFLKVLLATICTNMKIKVLRIRPQPLCYKTVEDQSKFNL